MRPLKVTCCLNSPLAGDPPKLDALLEWVMSSKMRTVAESSGGHKHRTGGALMIPGTIPIPIQRERVEGYRWPIPLCSDPIMSSPASDGVEHFTRRFPTEMSGLLAPGERKIVNVTGGEFKSYRLPLRVRRVDRIVWFCGGRQGQGNGNSPGKEIRKLLKRVAAVGKKTSDGYGRVASWTVEDAEADWSWYAPSPDGPVLMRTLPASIALPDGLIGYRPYFGAPVSPYWDSALGTEIVAPC